jgi:hypothetical protein
MRIASKVDRNQSDIVRALRAVGAEVQPLHTVGHGCVDLLVAYRGAWYVGEVKDGAKVKSAQKLTPDEIEWHERFSRVAPVNVWTCQDDALRTIGAIV